MAALGVGGALVGCSTGSTSGGNNGGGGNPSLVAISGRVTDRTGAPVVGATVATNTSPILTAITTQFGAFSIADVPIPSGQLSRVVTLNAQRFVGPAGSQVNWTGQNRVEIFVGESNLQNANVVVSDPAIQGDIAGTVRAPNGNALVGARVYAAQVLPPDPGNPTLTTFATLGAYQAITDSTGAYTLPDLPAGTRYLVTASFPGRLNQSFGDQIVQEGRTTTRNFTLNTPGTSPALPTVTGFSVRSITMPSQATRAANAPKSGVEAIRQMLLRKWKADARKEGAPNRVFTLPTRTRETPVGSNIESVLLWDYTQFNNLFGYVILRSIARDDDFRTLAVVQDPLADRYTDSTRTLTPNQLYYYSVARLDTINYPLNGAEGDPGFVAVVRPLAPITPTAPANGSFVNGAPVFQWVSVSRATKYQLLVYDAFPTLQSDTDPNGTVPIWPADLDNPGSSLITDGRTSQLYQGPALVTGRTYYWAILASDDVNSAFTISSLGSFIAQ